jgi:hypothetical protein
VIRALVLAIPLIGCAATGQSTDSNKDWNAMSLQQRQATLNNIADQCALARASLVLKDKSELSLDLAQSASFTSVDCALGKMRHFGVLRTSFVGEEVYREEKK